MSGKIQNVSFRAKWDDTNRHLQTRLPTTDEKVKNIAWNVVSILIPIIGLVRLMGYGLSSLARKCILPAIWLTKKERIQELAEQNDTFLLTDSSDIGRAFRNTFTVEHHTIMTPDGVALHAILYRHKETTSATPTVIYFNPNAATSWDGPNEIHEIVLGRGSPCNIVQFDYRATGTSAGEFSAAKDLVVDGSSIVQWVRDGLKMPSDQIYFCGASLGGAIAAQTQALDPKNLRGKHINIASFASLDQVAQEWGARIKKRVNATYFGLTLAVELLVFCLTKMCIWILKNYEHNIDAAGAFKKLQGRRLVAYHSTDTVIPPDAGLQKAVKEESTDFMVLSEPSKHLSLSLEDVDQIGQFIFS